MHFCRAQRIQSVRVGNKSIHIRTNLVQTARVSSNSEQFAPPRRFRLSSACHDNVQRLREMVEECDGRFE
jgi:hypothetical protein